MIFPFEGSQVGIYVKYAGFYGPEQLEKQRTGVRDRVTDFTEVARTGTDV